MKKLVLILMVLPLFFSCSGGDEETIDTTVSIYPSIISLDSYLPVDTFIMVSCKTDWKIENAPEWCTFDNTAGVRDSRVKIELTKNNTYEVRKAIIKINNAELTIIQKSESLKPSTEIGLVDASFDKDFNIVLRRKSGNVEYTETYGINKKVSNWPLFKLKYNTTGIPDNHYVLSVNKLLSRTTGGVVSEPSIEFLYKKNGQDITKNNIKQGIPELQQIVINRNPYYVDNDVNRYTFKALKIEENVYVYEFSDYKVIATKGTSYYTVNGKLKITVN